MNQFAMQRRWGPEPRYPKVLGYKRPIDDFIVIAGPCSVESVAQIHLIADAVAESGATHLRGGVFRAGTYPGKNFGWINKTLIEAFHKAARDRGIKNIIEILDYGDAESLKFVLDHADCVQVGARQMQNYTLLRYLSSTSKTVFLKRHPGATLDEWLGAAEHLLAGGHCHPVLIERGSSTNANHVRWDLSISMIPAVRAITEIPVIVDAAHGTGRRDLVEPMTLAGVAAGASGILVEVHPVPEESLSDPDQAITPAAFANLMGKIRKLQGALK